LENPSAEKGGCFSRKTKRRIKITEKEKKPRKSFRKETPKVSGKGMATAGGARAMVSTKGRAPESTPRGK